MCTGKPLLAEFQNTFGTIVFFPSCVYTSCKQSRSCFHGNIYLCEEFINPFSQEFHVEIPRRMQMGGVCVCGGGDATVLFLTKPTIYEVQRIFF